MPEETIVAVYDTAEHAAFAVRDLKARNVPDSAITTHTASSTETARTPGSTTGTTGTAVPETGFWASLFGGSTDDATVYDRSMQSGSTVVSVKVPDEHIDAVTEILELHNPIDIDDRAASYGAGSSMDPVVPAALPVAGAAVSAPVTSAVTAPVPTPAVTTATTATTAGLEGDKLRLAEEQLVVGKRAVNRGTTRIRRYVVETPVQEQVSLRQERVQVERHKLTDGEVVTPDFSEKVIEMTETGEEVVVGKTARVVEEVSLRKEAGERVETVNDTVRREEVDIVQVPATSTTTETTTTTTPVTPTTKRL